jgi:hypothetical protein
MVRKGFFALWFLVVFSGFVLGYGGFCVDYDNPVVSNLDISGKVNNVLISWDSSDSPECSGIEKYEIYREGVLIGETGEKSFVDGSVSEGSYGYAVIAVDEAGNVGNSSLEFEVGSGGGENGGTGNGGNGGSGGGGGSGGSAKGPGGALITFENTGGGNASFGGGENESINLTGGFTPLDEKGFFGLITGAVVGTLGNKNVLIPLGFVLLVVVGILLLYSRKKK